MMPFFSYSSYSAITPSDCLDCHNQYKDYIHGGISCTECHKDITMIPHKERLEEPQCIGCHSKTTKTYAVSVHAKRRIPCTACHNTHFITHEKKNCTACHRNVSHTSLPSGEKHLTSLSCISCHGQAKKGSIELSILINKRDIITPESIDRNGNNMIDRLEWDNLLFELSEKLQNNYSIRREYLVEGDSHKITKKASDCKTCHEENGLFSRARLKLYGAFSYEVFISPQIFIRKLPSIEDFKKTVHGKNRIRCNDCHTSQKQVDDTLCIGCHKDLYEIYKGTPHAKKGATRCMDCHNPHLVKPYRELSSSERVSVCTSCHKNSLKTHRWLPQPYLHFKYLECSTCHSPYSEKGIVFFIKSYEKDNSLTPLSYQRLSSIFMTEGNIKHFVDKDENGIVDARELNDFFAKLKRSLQENVSFDAPIIVTRIYHDHAVKGQRKRVCRECHSGNAPFYDCMYLALPDKNGLLYLPVKGTSLSMLPISVFVNLMLIGEAKLKWQDLKTLFIARGDNWYHYVGSLGYKWIDLAGIIMLCITACGIIFHILARILFKR